MASARRRQVLLFAILYIFPNVPLNGFIRRRGWLPEDVFKVLENETASFVVAHPRFLGPLFVVQFDEPYDSTKVDLLKQAGPPLLILYSAALPTAAELRASIAEAKAEG